MTLNDLNRKLRDIVNQLSSGEIPLVDKEGNEVSFDLALDHDTEGNLVCVLKKK